MAVPVGTAVPVVGTVGTVGTVVGAVVPPVVPAVVGATAAWVGVAVVVVARGLARHEVRSASSCCSARSCD